VKPLLAGWGLDFTAVHGADAMLKAHVVRSFPANFLYGADGRIYYRPGIVGTLDARRELELHIEALLDRPVK